MSDINCLKLLWDHLQDVFHAEYLCTNPLCQDFLENLFSDIRRKCGSNDSPDALQFGIAFKYAAIEASFKSCHGVNCEPDNTSNLVTYQDYKQTNVSEKKYSTYLKIILPPLDTSKPLEITTRELNGLLYVVGAAARRLPHKKCVHNLVQERNIETRKDDAYQFIKLKQLATSNFLNLPNKKLFDIGVLCFVAFNQKFSKFLSKNKEGVKTRLKRYINYDLFDDGLCQSCFMLLIDKIFNTFIQGFLKKTKAQQASKISIKTFKRNRKAGRMCLPL